MLVPQTKLEWTYFASTTVQAICITALQFTVLLRYLHWVNSVAYQVPVSYAVPISIAVFVGGCIYQALLTVDAFRIKNNIQLFAQCICNICLAISAAMQYGQIKHASYQVSLNEDMFHTPFVKRGLEHFWTPVKPMLIFCNIIIYLVLIKLLFYFIVAFVIVYGFVNVHYAQPEFSLTLGIIPVSFLHIGFAIYCIRVESTVLTGFTILVHPGGIAYLTSRIVVLCGRGRLSNTTLKDEQLLFAIAGLFFLFAATIAAVQCWLNFNKGLKPILLGQTQRKAPAKTEEEREYYFQRLNYAPSPLDIGRKRRFDID
ncbi:hypothetical protein B0J12DRAFT_598588 [Macrophomina phaseolina]|uniref:Uncharacterized protein n=1 Tax=Macrophomina phaseolina TaxID=35725 RepID=A0ABQ8GEU1_9PEZI|nr:hypothetical protein B0J12DRAFT_598588 [Macrophomina phaseolina]